MRRYRTAPVMRRVRSCDDWLEPNDGPKTIEVHVDERWELTGLLDADGKPIETYIGPDRPGFVWTQDDDE
jgi:hypothetical protein